MRIGIPREIKTLEGRVALVPAACGDLVRAGSKLGYAGDVVNVMYFDRGVLRDPLSVVLVPAEETDHSSKEER